MTDAVTISQNIARLRKALGLPEEFRIPVGLTEAQYARDFVASVGDMATCRGCQKTIWWIEHANKKKAPYTAEALNPGEAVQEGQVMKCPTCKHDAPVLLEGEAGEVCPDCLNEEGRPKLRPWPDKHIIYVSARPEYINKLPPHLQKIATLVQCEECKGEFLASRQTMSRVEATIKSASPEIRGIVYLCPKCIGLFDPSTARVFPCQG